MTCQFLLIALATFGSEDLTCIATGALIAAGKIGFVPGVLACLAGIYFGDLLLYFAGRFVGRPIVRWKPLRKLLTEQKLDGASEWLAQRGAGVVILSRFTPGLRLPTYVAAGLLRTDFWRFALYFLLAAVLWTPALVGAAAVLGKALPRLVYFGPAVLLVGAPLRQKHFRRRAVGWLRRKTRWEFWPPWLAYLPVVPYILYLGVKHRSLTLFTAANPGIPSGGFAGESKSAILANLDVRAGISIDSGIAPAGGASGRGEEHSRASRWSSSPMSASAARASRLRAASRRSARTWRRRPATRSCRSTLAAWNSASSTIDIQARRWGPSSRSPRSVSRR